MPEDAAFESVFAAENGATVGWFDPKGLARLASEEVSYGDKARESMTLVGGETPVPDMVTALCMAGLIAVALGGMAVQVRLFRILGRHANAFGPVSSALGSHPVTLWTLHIILYGGFFGFAALAIAFPLANMGLVEFVSGIFAEGRLRHLGEAYLSGRVLEAAFRTWFNNFVVQTALLTLVPAVLVPLAGAAWAITKHLLSFCLVGFVMAPLWSGSIGVLPFHAITVTVELEAYVIAGFVATVFQLRAARSVFEGIAATVSQLRDSGAVTDWGPWRGCVDAFLVLGSGTLLVGLLLAAAGLYEAVTLILLG